LAIQARGGIDLGGTKIQAVVVDGRNEVRGQARRATPHESGPPEVASAIVDTLREAAASASIAPEELIGVGIGSPGEIHAKEGVVAQARNLHDWEGSYPLGPAVAEGLGTKVALGNDVDVAVMGEFKLGAGKPYDSMLGVWWGTGVGGGIILNGQQWDGRGTAGEIGHVVVRIGGRRCGCGRRGCMEAYAGRASMEHRARKLVDEGEKTKLFSIMKDRGRDRLTSGVWARALDKDDKMARELFDEAIDALGAGVASVCNVLDVEAVIFGGGLGTRFGDEYVQRIRQAMMPHLFVDDNPPDVHVAGLGDLGGAIGAALLVSPPARRAPRRSAAKRG